MRVSRRSSDSDGRLDSRMMFVTHEFEILVLVVEDRRRSAFDLHLRIGVRRTRELRLHLLEMVAVDVAITSGPDEIAEFQIALLRHHHRQQRVAGDVEGHAEEDVCASLIQLAGQFALGHIELKKRVILWLQGSTPSSDSRTCIFSALLSRGPTCL